MDTMIINAEYLLGSAFGAFLGTIAACVILEFIRFTWSPKNDPENRDRPS